MALAIAALLWIAGCNRHEEFAWTPVEQRGVGPSPLGDEAERFYDRDQLSPSSSDTVFTLFVLLSIGGMLSASAVLWWLHRRRALLEERFDPRQPLRDGVAVIVGRVETADGHPAVVLRVRQGGTEWSHKGQWHHAWRESARELHVRPFVIRSVTGALVRVDPPRDVPVHGEFTRIERHDYNNRTCVIEVAHGQEIRAYGTLQGAQHAASAGAYRDASLLPTLVSTGFAPMVLSAEQPGATPRARGRVHRNMGIALFAWLLIACGAIFPRYLLLSIDSEVVSVDVSEVRQWREYIKPKNRAGYWRYHYEARGTHEGETVSDEVNAALYGQLSRGETTAVPFMVSSLRPSTHQFGNDPHFGTGRAVLAGLAALIFLIVYPIVAFTSRPWYLKKRVQMTGNGTIAQADEREASKAAVR